MQGCAEDSDQIARRSRLPTRILDRSMRPPTRRHHGLSDALPRIPHSRATRPYEESSPLATAAPGEGSAATWRRRWLLAIFGRMMARFYERHTRRLSVGRWECTLCRRRIVAWAWHSAPEHPVDEIVHEACVSRSVWDMVLSYEYMVNSGFVAPGSDPSTAWDSII